MTGWTFCNLYIQSSNCISLYRKSQCIKDSQSFYFQYLGLHFLIEIRSLIEWWLVAKIFHHVTCLVGMPQMRDSFPQAKSVLLFWGDEVVENRTGTAAWGRFICAYLSACGRFICAWYLLSFEWWKACLLCLLCQSCLRMSNRAASVPRWVRSQKQSLVEFSFTWRISLHGCGVRNLDTDSC